MASLYRESQGSTAKDCLTIVNNRSSTPPEIQKYRRSAYLEPGKRFQHYGIADDLQNLKLDSKIYGIQSDKGNGTAAEVVNGTKLSEAERLNRTRNEKIYKSSIQEPLGSKMDRKINIPSKFTQEKVPFGVKTKSSLEPAKEIIFPHTTDDDLEGEELYRRSHGTYGPGEQKRRDYQWPVDPNHAVFGVRGGTIAFNGASTSITEVLKGSDLDNSLISKKSVEDFRNTGDVLGMSRNLGQGSGNRPFDMIYGQTSTAISKSKGVHTAAEIIKGNYSIEQQLPDHDLGKSITPGFRNITNEDRVYGCPSVRTDLLTIRQGRRSVADAQNYGDDVPAKYLIYPPPFFDLAISPDAMKLQRSKEKLFKIFEQIGYGTIHPDVNEVIFRNASKGNSTASINAYRNALNEYLDAIETNRESEWLQGYGLIPQSN